MAPQERLGKPPSEIDIASAIEFANNAKYGKHIVDVLRRLAFQVDKLKTTGPRMNLYRWENASEQPDLVIFARDEEHARALALANLNPGDYEVIQYLRPVVHLEPTIIWADEVTTAKEKP